MFANLKLYDIHSDNLGQILTVDKVSEHVVQRSSLLQQDDGNVTYSSTKNYDYHGGLQLIGFKEGDFGISIEVNSPYYTTAIHTEVYAVNEWEAAAVSQFGLYPRIVGKLPKYLGTPVEITDTVSHASNGVVSDYTVNGDPARVIHHSTDFTLFT